MLPLLATKLASYTTPTKNQAHIAVCPFALPPHPELFFLLSRRIAAENRDVRVTMFTSPFYAIYLYWYWNPDEDQNLHFYPVGQFTTTSHNPLPDEIIRTYLDDFGKSVARAEEEFGEKITYVVADAFFADACRQLAEERGVKWSAVWNSSAACMAATINSQKLLTRIGVNEPVDDYLPGFPPGVSVSNLPDHVRITPASLHRHGILPTLLHHMTLSLPKAEAVLINSFHHLESDVASALLPETFHLGGPISLTLPFPPNTEPLDDPNGVFSWLDTRLFNPNSVIYIKLGEEDSMPFSDEYDATVEALEGTGISFLWFIPSGHWYRVKLIDGFIERTSKSGQGMVVHGNSSSLSPLRLPQWEMKVLSHKAVGAQLRESSWSSVIQSIAAGVPIICKPIHFEFDQRFNATLVESVWEIGIQVEETGLRKGTSEKLFKRMMIEDEGRKMRGKIAVLKKLVEMDVVHPNGKSLHSLNKFINLITKSSTT